jgi:hypothetical protein
MLKQSEFYKGNVENRLSIANSLARTMVFFNQFLLYFIKFILPLFDPRLNVVSFPPAEEFSSRILLSIGVHSAAENVFFFFFSTKAILLHSNKNDGRRGQQFSVKILISRRQFKALKPKFSSVFGENPAEKGGRPLCAREHCHK